jgi:hypothetical protein
MLVRDGLPPLRQAVDGFSAFSAPIIRLTLQLLQLVTTASAAASWSRFFISVFASGAARAITDSRSHRRNSTAC